MHQIKTKQKVFYGSEGQDWCAKGEKEAIGEQ